MQENCCDSNSRPLWSQLNHLVVHKPLLRPQHIAEIDRDGFVVIQSVFSTDVIDRLVEEVGIVAANEFTRRRAGKVFGIRNVLNVLPFARELSNSPLIRSFVTPILGVNAKVVRGTYFDEPEEANWKVPWHQDLTIALRQRRNVAGYGPWSIKAGIPHVQPPVSILENILTVRLHLDHTDEWNGALRVRPGSHKYGRLNAGDIESWKQRPQIIVSVAKGGVMLMRPLLLHASSVAQNPQHRRVLHFDFSSSDLPDGLEWFDTDDKSKTFVTR